MQKNQRQLRTWRIIGWVGLLLAIAIVAGPQILDLFSTQ
jgi:hypothetical protein